VFAGVSIDFHDFPVIVALNMNQTVSDDIDEEIHNCFLYQNKVKSLNKILPLVIVLSMSLIMGNQLQDAYGASPTSIEMEITSGPVFPITIHVENKDNNIALTDPCDVGMVGPCAAPVVLSLGDKFFVHPAAGKSDLTNDSHFFNDFTGNEFFFTNRGGPELHTSCSQPLVGETGTIDGYLLTVLSQQGGSGSNCPDVVVGGHGGPIDKTSLLVTGAQLNASWMIPVLVSAIGIGLFVVTRKS